MRKIGRSVSLVVAVLALLLAGSQAAFADPPDIEPLVADDLVLAAGEVCEFPVTLSAVTNRQQVITFTDGRTFIVGSFRTRVTNEDSGESIVVNNAGPFFVSPNPDGTTLTVKGTGKFLWYAFPGDLGPGEPGALLLTTGLTVETLPLDGSAVISFVRKGGTTENLCETLAD